MKKALGRSKDYPYKNIERDPKKWFFQKRKQAGEQGYGRADIGTTAEDNIWAYLMTSV